MTTKYIIHYTVLTLQKLGITPEGNHYADSLNTIREVELAKTEIIANVNKKFNLELDPSHICFKNIMKIGESRIDTRNYF